MADTFTVEINKQDARGQFQGLFSTMIAATVTGVDQDGIATTVCKDWEVTVPGAALGDLVLVAPSSDMEDAGINRVMFTGIVTAADTVAIRVMADDGTFAADTTNGETFKILVLRPNW